VQPNSLRLQQATSLCHLTCPANYYCNIKKKKRNFAVGPAHNDPSSAHVSFCFCFSCFFRYTSVYKRLRPSCVVNLAASCHQFGKFGFVDTPLSHVFIYPSFFSRSLVRVYVCVIRQTPAAALAPLHLTSTSTAKQRVVRSAFRHAYLLFPLSATRSTYQMISAVATPTPSSNLNFNLNYLALSWPMGQTLRRPLCHRPPPNHSINNLLVTESFLCFRSNSCTWEDFHWEL
jgi:hypothetical protein